MPKPSRRFELLSEAREVINVLSKSEDIAVEDAISALEELKDDIVEKIEELISMQ